MNQEIIHIVILIMNHQACDWGALDRVFSHFSLTPRMLTLLSPSENLATQRVQHLARFVTTAFIYGSVDPISRSEPLKVRTRCEVMRYGRDGTPTGPRYR